MPRPLDVVAALTQASREPQTPQDPGTRLDSLVTVARDVTPGVDHVGVVVRARDGETSVVAASDDVARALAELQVVVREGPVPHVLGSGTTLRVDHTDEATTWPAYTPRAASFGVRAQAGVPFAVDEHTTGALVLLSTTVDELDDEAVLLGQVLAAQAGLVLGHARQVDNLNAALQSRKLIGMALGMTMQRLGLDEETAFAYLTRISATGQTKLRDVAASIVQEHLEQRPVTHAGEPDDGRAS